MDRGTPAPEQRHSAVREFPRRIEASLENHWPAFLSNSFLCLRPIPGSSRKAYIILASTAQRIQMRRDAVHHCRGRCLDVITAKYISINRLNAAANTAVGKSLTATSNARDQRVRLAPAACIIINKHFKLSVRVLVKSMLCPCGISCSHCSGALRALLLL